MDVSVHKQRGYGDAPGPRPTRVKEKLVHSEKPHDPRTGHNSKQATTCQEKEKCSLL